MQARERLIPIDIPQLERGSGRVFLHQLKEYIEACNPAFPSYTRSKELLEREEVAELVDRLVKTEMEGKHSGFSHAVLVCRHAASVSRQLNQSAEGVLGNKLFVDEPLVTTSAFLHDIGNAIEEKDVKRWGLDNVDITPYVDSYPQDSPWRDLKNNHILKTVSLFSALGFPDHAHTTAHSIHHLLNASEIPLERLLLMLADFSVIDRKPEKGEWLQADFVSSLIHKMDRALAKHRGELKVYLQFHDRLQAAKSYMEKAGVIFPKPPGITYMRQGPIYDPETAVALSGLINYLALIGVERMGRMKTSRQSNAELKEWGEQLSTGIQIAITSRDTAGEATAKSALRDLIESSLRRTEAALVERIDSVARGDNGGEVLSGVSYQEFVRVCRLVVQSVDIGTLVDKTYEFYRQNRRSETEKVKEADLNGKLPVEISVPDGKAYPPRYIRNMAEFQAYLDEMTQVRGFPLETLKYPHLLVRARAWEGLFKQLSKTNDLTPSLAKKILTLCHFGSDATLYQLLPQEEENRYLWEVLYTAQRNVLIYLSLNQHIFHEKRTENAVIMGSAGLPFGQHHVRVLRSGLNALERQGLGIAEGFVSLDSSSRSKAEKFLSGEIPSLDIRRQIAVLQTVNEEDIHVLAQAIPIWFDTENIILKRQMEAVTPVASKVWRFIGGDTLIKYPQSPVYQRIPHVVDARGERPEMMTQALEKLGRAEKILLDTGYHSSSTETRRDIERNIFTEDINPLTREFIRHYQLFKRGE